MTALAVIAVALGGPQIWLWVAVSRATPLDNPKDQS